MACDLEGGERVIAAWRTNARATAYLVEHLPRELWAQAVPGVPRRSVRAIAAHLHNSRCAWIRALGGRHGIVAPARVDVRRVHPAELVRALARSSAAMVRLIQLGIAREGRVPPAVWQNFPTDLEHFLSYFVAHEAHHRGQLCLLARQLGRRLPKEVVDGLWQWKRLARERR